MTLRSCFESYRTVLVDVFEKISSQEDVFGRAGSLLADEAARDGLINVIGPGGHATLAVEEVLWRAGGLAPVNAILDAGTNLIHGAKRSCIMERTPGYAKSVLDAYGLPSREDEPLVIVNGYGINVMCVETVLEAKKRGMKTIAVTSRSFAERTPPDHPARHRSGKNLYEEADVFIDCCLPYGDAVVEFEGMRQKAGAVTTFCLCFAMNLLMLSTIHSLLERGIEPPLWMSANIPGGDAQNRLNEERYRGRIKHLF